MIGCGFVVRDEVGSVIAARTEGLRGPMNALDAEALSCIAALQWLSRNRYQKVRVESDSLLLVSAVNNSTEYGSLVGLIIQDCKILLENPS